ncbi:TIGR01777 family oxidoreductase [bacterium]|nr:TIGR01777 family oxidoreductase [bacterium]
MEYRLQSLLQGVSPEAAFAWHARPGALERLIPPWQKVRLLEGGTTALAQGARLHLQAGLGPLRLDWLAELSGVEPGHSFTDTQVRGPFRRWVHEHVFTAVEGGGSCVLTDRVEWEPPLPRLTDRFIANRLDRAFRWRHRVTASDLRDSLDYGECDSEIVVSGGSGLIGSALVPYLRAAGHRVRSLVRREPDSGDEFRWQPESGRLDPAALEGAQAVVHLAGESIAGGRWNERRKRGILESRVRGTELIARNLARLDNPPRVLVCASAVGFYGDRGEEVLDEDSPGGTGFLAGVCAAWEAACAPAAEAGVRVVFLRLGMVLSQSGGALRAMLPAFRLGLGGPLGRGEQYFGWIAIDDLLRVIRHVVAHNELSGPLIAAAPEATTSAQFSRALAGVLQRPAFLAAPAPLLRAALGEMGSALLLSSQRVCPSRLLQSGFRYRYPDLGRALGHLTGRLSETHILT